jgi:hypothetical protein
MNLSFLFKLAKIKPGGNMLDQMSELFGSAGINVNAQELLPDQRPFAFQQAANASVLPGARVVAFGGVQDDGSILRVLIVAVPADDSGSPRRRLLPSPGEMSKEVLDSENVIAV